MKSGNLKIVTAFIAGLLISGSVAYAVTLSGRDVSYDNTTSGLISTNVQDAITELKTNVDKVGAIKKFCSLKSGTFKAIGSLYDCEVGPNIHVDFYLLALDNGEARLIMEHNLTGENVNINWSQARNIFDDSSIQGGVGTTAKASWTNVINIDLPRAKDIANAVGNTSWNVGGKGCGNWFYLDPNPQTGDYVTTQVADSSNPSNYAWLYNHTIGCQEYGCTSTDSSSTGNYGYWTRDGLYSLCGDNDTEQKTPRAWLVSRYGSLLDSFVSTTRGVRPVISVLPSNLYEED